jgi:ABC-2 type transport system permease protein
VILVCAAAFLQVVIARVVFDVPWTGGVASWMLMIAAGGLAFAGTGFVIAAWARAPHVANTAANLVFIPMLALGGTALPASMMPDAWARIHGILPTATIFEGLLGAFIGGETAVDNLPRLGYLALWAIVMWVCAAVWWNRRAA